MHDSNRNRSPEFSNVFWHRLISDASIMTAALSKSALPKSIVLQEDVGTTNPRQKISLWGAFIVASFHIDLARAEPSNGPVSNIPQL